MSAADYNAIRTLPAPTATARFGTSNRTVPDVVREFSRIRTDGDYLRAWDGGQIPAMRYTANVKNDLGFQNHLQGIQRLRRGKYLVISGGDPHAGSDGGPASHLFVLEMKSRRASGPWGSNVVRSTIPPVEDRIVRVIGVERELWHAGGMSVAGDVLVVPAERSNPSRSRIVFFNMARPEKPQRFRHTVERPNSKAAATALTRLPNGRYVLAVWNAGQLDCYLSRSAKFADGFGDAPLEWGKDEVVARPGQQANFSDFQTINFINQADGGLYLVGLHNTSDKAPTVPGRDYADLFSVRFPDFMLGPDPVLGRPIIAKVAKRHIHCHDQQANMDAAAGTYVDRKGHLIIYAAWHWRSDNLFRFNEYRAIGDATDPPITRIGDGWIDLYEDPGFRGRRLSIIGTQLRSIPTYREINVQGASFDDRVSSMRFQLPVGTEYVLYTDPGYYGEALVLSGSGLVEEVGNIHSEFGIGGVRSSRYERAV